MKRRLQLVVLIVFTMLAHGCSTPDSSGAGSGEKANSSGGASGGGSSGVNPNFGDKDTTAGNDTGVGGTVDTAAAQDAGGTLMDVAPVAEDSLQHAQDSGAAPEDTTASSKDTGSGDVGAPDAGGIDTIAPPTDTVAPPTDTGPPPNAKIATDKGLKVAFIGDSGATIGFAAALDLIKAEKADFVMHQGDFDYEHSPALFDGIINSKLGDDFPYFVSVGNHDLKELAGYQKNFNQRLAKVKGASCNGELGVMQECTYRGLHMLFVAPGTKGTDHHKFIEERFGKSKHLWKIVSWHKNQKDMQTGEKTDEVGWDVYKSAAKMGALITTGHEHAYNRTMNLTAIGDTAKGHGAVGPLDVMTVKPGQTFVTVTGTGGKTLRDFKKSLHGADTWWATIYTNDLWRKNGKKQTSGILGNPNGVLFITFHVDGDPKKATGYFKNTLLGQIVDEFTVVVE